VVSHTLQERYRSRESKQRLHVPNGTDIRQRRSRPNLARLGLQPYGYVLFLVRLSPEENCGFLIEAFEDTETPLKLVLAGGSSHTDAYAASLRDHASDRIKILDSLSGDALQEVLTHPVLFVLASDLEGLSRALLDATGAGV